jgi:hypothetical protein
LIAGNTFLILCLSHLTLCPPLIPPDFSNLELLDHCWEDQFFVNGDHFFLILERVIAGVFGAMTLPSQNLSQTKNLKTLYIETLPAIVAILLVSMIRN